MTPTTDSEPRPMTHDEVMFSSAWTMCTEDGLDAVEPALALYRSSQGEPRKQALAILRALRLMFQQIAPKTNSAHRWEKLRAEIAVAID